MITTQPVWPLRRPYQTHRPLIALALALVSLSGLLSGLALRPLTRGLLSTAGVTRVLTSAPASSVAATPQIVAPVATPQAFFLGLNVTPQEASPGDTITVRALAQLSQGSGPAPGVSCSLAITGQSKLPAVVARITDTRGQTAWAIILPAGTPPGVYAVTVSAAWGEFRANWQVSLVVR